jgi:chromosome segregation ATPase
MSDVYISSNEFERLHNGISSLQEEIKAQRRHYEDEYAKLWQMYGDLEEERDQLRDGGKRMKATLGRICRRYH